MALAAEKEMKHIGESCGCADHDHDLIHDLSKRLDALWRYDQYIAIRRELQWSFFVNSKLLEQGLVENEREAVSGPRQAFNHGTYSIAIRYVRQ